ncbi:hypothetical protein K461DRAFT_129337 [Myriangium duriaei CBS 260.36]|uniref:Zn(2)-C6 fungal-type domain-containing protein n=1 Tax=Myriangium duriaei CBS 260.36 TaxID=1168546 RepID=A0A9P4J2U0_9PEZI|nr:hypothetical protein K461DRAFT_129337 [Myriangium duriaei CBS 260.36]
MTDIPVLNRPILPAPVQGQHGIAGGGSSGGGSGPPHDKHEPKQKRAQISVACEVCRRRKAKCDGVRPTCTPCQTRHLDCHYVADPDTTRMVTLKRKYQALTDRNHLLESQNNTFRSLFDLLRGPDANTVLEHIRSGASVDDIVRTSPHAVDTSVESGSDHHETEPVSPTEPTPSQLADSSESRRSSSFSSVRDRMNLNALLSTASSSDVPSEGQVSSNTTIPHRGRILSLHRPSGGRGKKG